MHTATVISAASPHCRLALNAAHHLKSDRDGPSGKTMRFPEDVDIVLDSDLVFTLSGVLNGVKVSSTDILQSQLAQHLADYFQANATELGLASVSSMCIGEDGLPRLTVISSRCLTPESELRRIHVALVGIDLNYVWNTSKSDSEPTSNSLIHPFANHLSLPFQMLLDNVICRFFTWHLVRRYPLIFGPWCQQLDVEIPYFIKIFRSISGIIARSPNPSFRKKCTRMLRTMHNQHAASFASATDSLAHYLGRNAESHEPDEDSQEPELTDEEAFSLSMELRYRTSLRRPQFKGSNRTTCVNDKSDDEELSQDQFLLTPESSQRFDEDFLWHNPSSTLGADFGIDFDLPLVHLASSDANIEPARCLPLEMGTEIEYQDSAEVWSDLDAEATDFLSLSSDNESTRRDAQVQHFGLDLTDDDFSLVMPQSPSSGANRYRLRLDWDDVNMDRTLDSSHADGSPHASVAHPFSTRIQALSPPAERGNLTRRGTAEVVFPGPFSKHYQAATEPSGLDGELCFDWDSSSEPHDLEEFGDVTVPEEQSLEHQVSNGSRLATSTEVGAGIDGMDREDLYFELEEW